MRLIFCGRDYTYYRSPKIRNVSAKMANLLCHKGDKAALTQPIRTKLIEEKIYSTY
jgi:Holliday junction resolvase RusA-like endonuclease